MKKQLWHAVIQIFPYRNYIKTAKMVAFERNCWVKMTLRLFYSISIVMNMIPMLRQFKRLAQRHCWLEWCQLTLKQLILKLHLWKNICSSLLPAYWEIQARFLFFSWQIKMSKASARCLRCTFMVYSRDTEGNVLMSCSLKATQYMDQTNSQLYNIWMSVPKVLYR